MEKILKIKNSIDPIVLLNDEEIAIFSDVFVSNKLSKNDFFLKEGEICDFIGFVNFGVLIYFKTNENGDEITTDFAFDGDWVTNNQSRLKNTSSKINIRAIEDTEIFVMKQHDLTRLYLQNQKLRDWEEY